MEYTGKQDNWLTNPGYPVLPHFAAALICLLYSNTNL